MGWAGPSSTRGPTHARGPRQAQTHHINPQSPAHARPCAARTCKSGGGRRARIRPQTAGATRRASPPCTHGGGRAQGARTQCGGGGWRAPLAGRVLGGGPGAGAHPHPRPPPDAAARRWSSQSRQAVPAGSAQQACEQGAAPDGGAGAGAGAGDLHGERAGGVERVGHANHRLRARIHLVRAHACASVGGGEGRRGEQSGRRAIVEDGGERCRPSPTHPPAYTPTPAPPRPPVSMIDTL